MSDEEKLYDVEARTWTWGLPGGGLGTCSVDDDHVLSAVAASSLRRAFAQALDEIVELRASRDEAHAIEGRRLDEALSGVMAERDDARYERDAAHEESLRLEKALDDVRAERDKSQSAAAQLLAERDEAREATKQWRCVLTTAPERPDIIATFDRAMAAVGQHGGSVEHALRLVALGLQS